MHFAFCLLLDCILHSAFFSPVVAGVMVVGAGGRGGAAMLVLGEGMGGVGKIVE